MTAGTRLLFASTVTLSLSLSCTIEGPQGATGPVGPSGAEPGSSPDCPDGYNRDMTQTSIVLCLQGADEVVKVGKKGSAFWIDRYEASVWQNADGTGQQYGDGVTNFPSTFPNNGQYSVPVYAVSKSGVLPSTTTWFQANEACRASGKKLPSSDEWLTAARGTLDPGANNGTNGACVTSGTVRKTGGGTQCLSFWGAQDMIGNAWEWNSEWMAGLSVSTPGTSAQWPSDTGASYGADGTYNVTSHAITMGTVPTAAGIPAAVLRGGSAGDGTGSGIFALDLDYAPTAGQGFRCVIPR